MPPSLRKTFVEKYALLVTNAYGTVEVGFVAYSADGNMAMRLLETSIVQIANPETGQSVGTGEVGQVVVTTFNETCPLIRLGMGDLAMNVDPASGQSRQGERSIILIGRVGDTVKVRGMFVHPNQLGFAVAHISGVTRFQAVITCLENRDKFTLRILGDGSLDQETLTSTLSVAIQSACRVKMDGFEFVSADSFKENEAIILDAREWE